MTRLVIPADVDYTTFDFDAYGARIDRAIPTVFPDWTDKSKANIGVIVTEAVQFTGDVISEYANGHSREAHLSVCSQLVNAQRHARKLAYIPGGRTAATVTQQVTLAVPAVNEVTLAAGQTVRAKSSTTDVVRVQMLTDLVIAIGQTQSTASAEHSETKTHGFESDDSKDQQEELPLTPFVEIPAGGVTDAVGTWTQVDNFLDSNSGSFHFRLLQSADGRAILLFGDGNQGRVPTGSVSITYKIGGGLVSIEPGDLTIPEFDLNDSLGNPVEFTTTNTTGAAGGSDRESVDEIRINAPASLAATNRSVTKTDYETNALRVDGLARALMLTSDQDVGIAENTGKLYLVARGAQLASGRWAAAIPTAAQITEVEALIANDYPSTITFSFEALSAVFQTIDIVCRVRLREGYLASAVDANIRAALGDYFAALNENLTPNTEIDFGYNYKDQAGDPDPFVPWSDIFNAVRDADGVRLVDKSTFQPYDDVAITGNVFPQLGDVTILDDLTGLALV